MKKCPGCKENKDLDSWGKNFSKKDGLASYCKLCSSDRVSKSQNKNIVGKKDYDRKYTQDNRERIAEREKKYREGRRDITAAQALLRLQNPQEKIAHAIRRNLRGRVLSGNDDSYFEDWGCTVATMRNHIESLFQNEMSWDNYGKGGWTFDHVAPLSSFDLTNPAEVALATHYTNVQPLWFGDNVRKYNKPR